ncbi:MAG: ATP-binding protein [Bacilli bacterium]|nr:ATP-binding protein [Bacilli bacterium]
MLNRKIEKYFDAWLKQRNTALLIKGARQVGKTYSINKFIDSNFKHKIVIDFAQRMDLVDAFAQIKNYEQLLIRLSAIDGPNLVPKETVIFFDEIQVLYKRREELAKKNMLDEASQDLITAIKPLVIEGSYRYILSGSLLGVTLNNVVLNPTGYLDIKQMYPLDFEEYLLAKRVGENVIDYLRKCFLEKESVDEEIHKIILNHFKEYVLIGGMPQAVSDFINTKNVYTVEQTQTQIIDQYTIDITKYIDEEVKKLRVREIYKAIPSELNSKNKRFMSSHILTKSELNRLNLIDEYLWLTNAGIAIPVFNVSAIESPLAISVERKTLKLFINDIGLLDTMLLATGIRERILNNDKVINYGAPYENVCAQELLAHGFNEKLYYYNSKKHGEIDFVIEYNNEVLPIEIKSGKADEANVYNHSALNNALRIYDIKEAYVFGETNYFKENDRIHQFPIYMISFINN